MARLAPAEFRQIGRRQQRPRQQYRRRGTGKPHGVEVRERVIGQLFVESCIGDVRTDGPKSERVAVGRGLDELRQPDRPAGAADVFDHDRLLEVNAHALRDGAGQRVAGAARRKRHDERDRSRGKSIRRDCHDLGRDAPGHQGHGGEAADPTANPAFQIHGRRPSSQGINWSRVGDSKFAGGARSGRLSPTRLCQ